MNHLTVYKFDLKKRFGRDFDGGYVTAILPIKYTILISAGIDNDSSFEDQFVDEYFIKCVAFDGTISNCPSKNKNVTWIKNNISDKCTSSTSNLHDLILKNEYCFIKMDIEGSEIPWLKSLTKEHYNNIAQLVIEFHDPVASKLAILKILETHQLVHLHGNNCCGTSLHEGRLVANVFECTFIHKKFSISNEKSTDLIPGLFDMPNIQGREDLKLI